MLPPLVQLRKTTPPANTETPHTTYTTIEDYAEHVVQTLPHATLADITDHIDLEQFFNGIQIIQGYQIYMLADFVQLTRPDAPLSELVIFINKIMPDANITELAKFVRSMTLGNASAKYLSDFITLVRPNATMLEIADFVNTAKPHPTPRYLGTLITLVRPGATLDDLVDFVNRIDRYRLRPFTLPNLTDFMSSAMPNASHGDIVTFITKLRPG